MKASLVRSSSKPVGRQKTMIGRSPAGTRSMVGKYLSSARGAGISKPVPPGTMPLTSFVARLQTLLKQRNYSSMMRTVTPAFFQRGLRDTAARKGLLRLENALLREAQRLLSKGDYNAATKLLNKIVRLGGPLSSRAQALKKSRTKTVVERRASPGGQTAKGKKKKAVKKNGGGARAPKPSRPKPAASAKGVKKAAKKAVKKAAKRPVKKAAKKTKFRVASEPSALPGESMVLEYAGGAGGPYPIAADEYDEYGEGPGGGRGGEDGDGANGSAGNGGNGGGDGERRGSKEKEQTEVLRRTPHMDLSTGEAPLAPAAEFDVYVSVDSREARPGEETQELELEGPASQEEFPVEVTLIVSGHFEPPQDGSRPMTVLRSGDTAPIVFKVRCAKQFPAEKDGALSALFQYQGHPSGRVTRRFKVENGKLVLAAPGAAEKAGAAAAPVPIASTPKLAAVSGLDPYDLTISVIDTGENDLKHFHLIADSPPTGKHLEVNWTLGDSSDQLVRNYMAKFVAQGLKPTTRLAELRGAGAQLFKSTPKEFQQLFWETIDSGKPPKTIMVISDEPYLPWELMVPRRMVAGKLVSRSPLGVEFCVGRWIRSDYISAPQQIYLDKTYVIAPKYVIATKNLKFAPQEAAFVCSSFHPSEQINPADIDPINNALRDNGATLLHFICHGAAGVGADQTILLQDMINNLSPSTIDGLDGFLVGFPRDHTFVFLNACEVGRTAPALVGIGGFASTFLNLGASGVVAALWSVKDDLAHQVAQTFYERVLKEPDTPFAEILRDIRAQAYSGKAEDTYAAYCFYGSPLAKRKT